VVDFLVVNRFDEGEVEGAPLAAVRKARFASGNQADLWSLSDMALGRTIRRPSPPKRPQRCSTTKKPSGGEGGTSKHEQEGFDHAAQMVRSAVRDLGTDWACDLFFAGEREYWQSRNTAGRVQKARQDGWAWAGPTTITIPIDPVATILRN